MRFETHSNKRWQRQRTYPDGEQEQRERDREGERGRERERGSVSGGET